MDKDFIRTGIGSATSIIVDGKDYALAYEDKEKDQEKGTPGPPWGKESSMYELCKEVGVDINRFLEILQEQKTDEEAAQELAISPKTLEYLKEKFFSVEAINGNYGQD